MGALDPHLRLDASEKRGEIVCKEYQVGAKKLCCGVPNLPSLSNKDSENKHSLGNVYEEDQWISKFYLAISQNKYALFKP